MVGAICVETSALGISSADVSNAAVLEQISATYKVLEELGIQVNLNAEVSEVRRENGRVTGLVANGTFHAADIIVSNMEVIPAYEKLLNEDKAFIASLERKLEPACSGLVIELGLDCPAIAVGDKHHPIEPGTQLCFVLFQRLCFVAHERVFDRIGFVVSQTLRDQMHRIV